MTRKNPERPTRTVKEIVEYNASMIHEVYESVMKLRRAVAILHDELIRDELEDLPEIPELEDLPDPELEEVARLHAEWDGKSPHPYGCDGGEGPDAAAKSPAVLEEPFYHCTFAFQDQDTCSGYGNNSDGTNCEYRDSDGRCHSADRATIWRRKSYPPADK